MIISIGSRSEPKIAAIMSAFSKYPEIIFDKEDSLEFLLIPKEERKETLDKDLVSNVSFNAINMEEIIEGAKNRAKFAYEYALSTKKESTYGVGIEAGIFPVESLETGYFDISICAIYDGKNYFIGGSPTFEYPKKVVERLLNGEEAGKIVDYFGEDAKSRPGVIGPLTKNRVLRDEFEEYAILMALTKIVSPELYK